MKTAFLITKGLLCLYDKLNHTWLLLDMVFLFSCSTRHPTRSLRSLVSYRVKHSKRNSISMRILCIDIYIYIFFFFLLLFLIQKAMNDACVFHLERKIPFFVIV